MTQVAKNPSIGASFKKKSRYATSQLTSIAASDAFTKSPHHP
jgi:hypothetical protein